MPDGSSTAHIYRPKLIETFLEGYGADALQCDLVAAVTVAVVALPLSMAIAVASGVGPERGLYTAIVGGFVVSALGGSRVQIGGPAGAFIVLVATTVARYGIDGLLVAVLLSGLLLVLVGLARLGRLICLVPHAVTVGFTCGIAFLILASQLKDFAGLTLSGAEPGPIFPKLAALSVALPTTNVSALAVGAGCASLIVYVRRWRPSWPGMLMAVAIASIAAFVLRLPVDTIGSRFGHVASRLPVPALPRHDAALLVAVIPSAVAFAFLGGFESLLSARIADAMTGRRHRYNMELVAQGLANIASACFGGISVTGTIARTATNVRAGARSPIAGMMHSIILLAFMLVAAPLMRFVPLAALAGVLVVVVWDMVEKRTVASLLRNPRSAIVLLATFGATLLRDLVTGVIIGCAFAGLFALLQLRASAEAR
jgi:sulfate permease, SulP family